MGQISTLWQITWLIILLTLRLSDTRVSTKHLFFKILPWNPHIFRHEWVLETHIPLNVNPNFRACFASAPFFICHVISFACFLRGRQNMQIPSDLYHSVPFSGSCASAVVYYYFQGFSAGHKRIISYSSTWKKKFILPLFQRWTQVKVVMTWFIIIWMDDGELIAFDGASRNAAYETKYKLSGNVFRRSEKKYIFHVTVSCAH